MGKIIEGVWDCAYCGETKVPGSVRNCPKCGHPRDNNVTFYIDDPHNYVTDETEIAKAKQGPDWICPACDCLNPAGVDVCIGCSTPRDSTTKDYFQNQIERHQGTRERMLEKHEQLEEDVSVYKQEEQDWQAFKEDYVPPATPKPIKQKPWKKILAIGAAILLLVAIVTGMVFLLLPKEVIGTVDGFAWERTIEIEQYKTVREEDWSIPVGGRQVSQRQEVHHYDRVVDHYETKTRQEQYIDHYEEYVTGYKDLGNGRFEEITAKRPVYKTRTVTYEEPVYRQVPVYHTKYTYDIDKWIHDSNKTTMGTDKSPYWHDYQCGENERKGSKSEVYRVIVTTEDGATEQYSVSFSTWERLQLGQHVRLKVSITGDAELITGGEE